MMTVCETATNYMHMLFLTDYRLIFQVDIERPLDLSRLIRECVRVTIFNSSAAFDNYSSHLSCTDGLQAT